MSETPRKKRLSRIDVLLICGGRYHDFDYARLELLKLLAEYVQVRVTVRHDYSDLAALEACDALITYTCDEVPDAECVALLQRRVREGLRWYALHGTNSILQFAEGGAVLSPPLAADLRGLLGSEFRAHPPIGRFTVRVDQPDHVLCQGVTDFEVEDEQYLLDFDSDLDVLMSTRFGGSTPEFEIKEWDEADHPVFYLKSVGDGAVLYLTLGHCRGHFDLLPLAPYYPRVERCSWESEAYYRLLRNGIRWAIEAKLPQDEDNG